MPAKIAEYNWFLLFDIALSHGESLRKQRLSYGGFLTLLRSAGLFGPKTGVYQVLLEALWLLHGQLLNSSEEKELVKEDKNIHNLTVDFDGFVSVMNVVCVRCFQTQRCLELIQEPLPVSEAIILSAEDQVQLKDSVVYTARQFFKPLINRCIVMKRMVVTLNSMKNEWTPYTNQFITHVVGSSAESIIFPLFYRYAKDGRIYRGEFENMIEDIFPNFTPIQKKSAVSVFDYRGFFGIHDLMKYCSLKSKESIIPALELDSFAESLLMLGIVAFSDEVQYEHHRPLTAKIWSVFEDYYSKFMDVSMISDPIMDNKYAPILPAVSLVFPVKIPIYKVSSFIIGGWNLTVDERLGDASIISKDYPPRILQTRGEKKNSVNNTGRRISAVGPSSPAGLAYKLFEEELNRPSSAGFDLPLYGMKRCSVYVNQYRTTAIQRGPNRVEVIIPTCMWDISIHSTRIYFDESGEEGKLTLSPTTKATISLKDTKGVEIYSSKEILFMAAPLVEYIPVSQMQELKKLFSNYALDGLMPLEKFNQACSELCISTLISQDSECSSFLKLYLDQKNNEKIIENNNNNNNANNNVDNNEDNKSNEDSISFSDFVSAVATLLLHQLEKDGCLPDIPCLLGIALSRVTQKLPPLTDQKISSHISLIPQPPTISSHPHNARIDVPYTNALRQKNFSLQVDSGFEKLLKSVGKDRSSMRPLPDFPPEAKTLSVISQYDDDENGLRDKVRKTSTALREAFLKKEMVVCHQGWKSE